MPFRFIHAAVVVAIAAGAAIGADWPHWRGPSRNGVTSESSGYREGQPWPAGEPLWRANVGAGASSPIVADGRLYVQGWRDDAEQVVALDAATGNPVWRGSYRAPKYGRHAVGDQSWYDGPSATPEYDAGTGRLFTLGIDGDLVCWEAKSGERVWGLNLYEKYGVGQRPQSTRQAASQRDYGYTSSPLVHGDTLIVEVGDDEGTLMGFAIDDGARRWTSQAKGHAGHTGGPVPITVGGVACVAVLRLEGLLVTRIDRGHEGDTVAELPWATDYANNIPTPAVAGDHVVLTTSHNQSKVLNLRITLQGAQRVWEMRVASQVCSPVAYDGHVYFADAGLTCLDLATGETRWDGGRFGVASSLAVTADGRIVVWSNEGDLALVEGARRSPDRFRQLAAKTSRMPAEAWPHVAIADGRVYGKDRAGNVICFALPR